jgi:exoribonuclease-2
VTVHVTEDLVRQTRGQYGDAQLLVSELMILANECAADYTRRHGVPSIYRVQHAPPPAEVAAAALLPPDVRALHLLPFMAQAVYSAVAAPHAGLGLRAYSHASSPIRRYSDIVVHRQLLAHMAGERVPYDTAAVQRLAAHVDQVARQTQALQRASERFWALTVLAMRPDCRLWRALVLECTEVDEGLLGEGTEYYFHVRGRRCYCARASG